MNIYRDNGLTDIKEESLYSLISANEQLGKINGIINKQNMDIELLQNDKINE